MAQPGEEYEVLELVGRGSFGQIHKVRRKRDGHILARKEISYVRMSQKEKDQLNAEFSILSRLQHPNIVQYYHREHNRTDQSLYLYMEFCGGGDLAARIKACRAEGTLVPETVVWTIFTQTVLALYKCHNGVDAPAVGTAFGEKRKGLMRAVSTGREVIVHRDLKPENVFLDCDNSVKLGDFGLSKILASDQHLATTYVGTPYYMSPEIVCDLPYTSRSDIWSLGCVIYELCRLAPPFNANTHLGLCQKIKEGRYPPLPSQYSAELRRVVDSCLKINPSERPDTGKLLELDVMRLMRREIEAAEISRTCKAKEELIRLKERDLELRERSLKKLLEEETARLRVDIDTELRTQWQLKADTEIKRRVEMETKMLFENYEKEMAIRFDEAVRQQRERDRQQWNDEQLSRRMNSMNVAQKQSRSAEAVPTVSVTSAYSTDSTTRHCSTSTAAPLVPPASPPRNGAFLGHGENFAPPSPMDISMSSPMNPGHASHFNCDQGSPLQQRKQSNLYSMIRSSSAATLDDPSDDEEEENDGVPAPLKNVKRPARPFLRMQSAPVLPQQGFGQKPVQKQPTTPTRRRSGNSFGNERGLPLAKNYAAENKQTSPTRRLLFGGKEASSGVSVKAAVINNKRAKSIVDIAKERNEAKERDKENTADADYDSDSAAVWDEAVEAEMPSPFLTRVSRRVY